MGKNELPVLSRPVSPSARALRNLPQNTFLYADLNFDQSHRAFAFIAENIGRLLISRSHTTISTYLL